VAAGPAHGTIQVAFDAAATEAFTNPMGETNRGESMFGDRLMNAELPSPGVAIAAPTSTFHNFPGG
jgi:hypothetical protein